MTILTWLKQAESQLKLAGIVTARLDCLVILEDILGKDRTQLLADGDQILSNEHIYRLKSQISRRANHEPLSYMRGKTEFYGREFLVSKDTLEPRPETETMIDLAKKLTLPRNPKIADVGAGSGAIGITLAHELVGAAVKMYEISLKAIKIAQKNIKNHGVQTHIYKNDLLAGTAGVYDLVVANLPYVPNSHTINSAAMQEPKIAIFGGVDGLDLYRKLFKQLAKLRPKYVMTESLPFQHNDLAQIAQSAGFKLQETDDFIQLYILI